MTESSWTAVSWAGTGRNDELTLDEKIAEANRLGISYGRYQAMFAGQERPMKQIPEVPEGIVIGPCVVCGADIIRPNLKGRPKTCSIACREELNRRSSRKRYHDKKKEHPRGSERPCAVCGKLFRGEPRMVYCSKECREVANLKRTKERYRKAKLESQKAAPPVLSRNCKHCGTAFETENPRRIFCSKKCATEHSRRRPTNGSK